MTIRRWLFLTLPVALALAPPASAQVERPFARYPAISPDGRTVAFSYQGDIWTVPVDGGRAMRLTLHEAYEANPRFSPDGKQIAFTSDRFGNDDVFVMSVDGSQPRRLTYHSAPDVLSGWTPDGQLLFGTRRTYVQVEWEQEFYQVSTRGGTPHRILDAVGFEPRMSPDGAFIAFTAGSNNKERKHYHGTANKEIWLYNTGSHAFTRFTDFDGNDFQPVFADARTLYYISEQDGTYNLYRATVGDDGRMSGTPQQLTRFVDDGVRTFDVTPDGRTIVLERQTDLYVMRDGGQPAILRIDVPADDRFDPVVRRTFTGNAVEYAVSPDGKSIAFVVRGEIFVKRNDPKENRTVRLTDSPARDHGVQWLDDHVLIFSSDRNGQYDLYRLESADPEQPDLFLSLKHRAVRLTDTKAEEHDVVVAPDHRHLTFLRGRGTLIAAEMRDGKLHELRTVRDGWATPEGVAWSPDSRWLAYSLEDLDFNSEVYIDPLDGSHAPVNVTMHPKGDGDPVWSADGSKLGFISQRNNGDADVWFAWLHKADWQKTQEDWKEEKDETQAEKPKTEKPAAPAPVVIDLDGIYRRLSQVTSLPGNESDLAISPDGQTFYFVDNRSGRQTFNAEQDLYSVKWDGTGMKALTTGGYAPARVTMGPGGKYLFMGRSGGHLARIKVDNGKPENLPFSARMTINYPAERAQVFDEAWRVLNEGYYDPNFHGADWSAMHDKYRVWALKASTGQDFRDVFNMMLGELNSSHVGFSSPERAETQRERTGLLGVEIQPLATGVRVMRVVPNSPADRETSRLLEGDVITAVEGTPVTEDTNFYSLLTDRPNQETILTVRREGKDRDIVIRPTGSLRSQLYEEWVQDRKALTEKYSNGRLGYIHVQGMNWPSFERFERELVAAGQGKDGLLVDVRYNGGGWTTDYMMAVLTVRQHAYTIPRGAAKDLAKEHTKFRQYYPYGERLPLASWTKPVAALCNQNSYSNAEIFSHAFKTLGLGPLIGTPTFGAVISTGGARLMDGSFVRLPFRGWYVKATDKDMEWGPAIPDVIVPTLPNARANGEDEQLRAAVKTLLGKIDGNQ